MDNSWHNHDWQRCGCQLRRGPIQIFSELLQCEIVNFKNYFPLRNFLRSDRWRNFCSNHGGTHAIFECFMKLTYAKGCDNSLMRAFLESCGYDLANWVIHFCSVASFSMILHHAQNTKFNLWEKQTSYRSIILRNYPVTKCVTNCKWENLDLLLSYGYNLEYKDCLLEKLVRDISEDIAILSKEQMMYLRNQRNCLNEFKFKPNRKRCFFTCLVIWTYLNTYRGCDTAWRSIWKHLPDSYLTKGEFLRILDPLPANLSLLAGMYGRYISTVCDGDYSLVKQPRTLAHHSRCKIRQKLCSNFSLPDGVQELPIPDRLKNFLLHK